MVNITLQSLFRDSKNRVTDRAAFAQAVSRLSEIRSSKIEERDSRKSVKDKQKSA